MRLNFGVQAGQLDDLFRLGHGIDGGAQDVALHVPVEFPAALLQLDQLGLGLKSIEQDDAAIVGQSKSGRHVRRPGLVRLAFRFEFLVEGDSLRGGLARGTVFFVLVGRGPVHHRFGDFFPLIALGTQVAHAIALDLPFSGQLIAAVGQDQALGELLRRHGRGQHDVS